MIKTFSIFLFFLISSSVSAQGIYTYVEAKDLNEYGIELHVEKEEDVGRWCLDFIYPKIMKGDEYKVFQHSSYLLKHEYLTTAIDKAPAQYFDLASKEISNISEKLKTDFCIAKEFLIGAEVQLFYEHKPKKLGFEQTEIIWIQNIDKILFEN